MIALVEDKNGNFHRMEVGKPVCGEDFCDECGDCLHCYGIDEGYCNPCKWIIYQDDDNNPIKDLSEGDKK